MQVNTVHIPVGAAGICTTLPTVLTTIPSTVLLLLLLLLLLLGRPVRGLLIGVGWLLLWWLLVAAATRVSRVGRSGPRSILVLSSKCPWGT